MDALYTTSAATLNIFNNSYTFFIVCVPNGTALNAPLPQEIYAMPFAITGYHTGVEFQGDPTLNLIRWSQYFGGTWGVGGVYTGGESYLDLSAAATQGTTYLVNTAVTSAATSTFTATINGTSLGTDTDPGIVTQYGTHVNLGAGDPTQNPGGFQSRFQGDIAEVVAYSRVLTPTEVSEVTTHVDGGQKGRIFGDKDRIGRLAVSFTRKR